MIPLLKMTWYNDEERRKKPLERFLFNLTSQITPENFTHTFSDYYNVKYGKFINLYTHLKILHGAPCQVCDILHVCKLKQENNLLVHAQHNKLLKPRSEFDQFPQDMDISNN